MACTSPDIPILTTNQNKTLKVSTYLKIWLRENRDVATMVGPSKLRDQKEVPEPTRNLWLKQSNLYQPYRSAMRHNFLNHIVHAVTC